MGASDKCLLPLVSVFFVSLMLFLSALSGFAASTPDPPSTGQTQVCAACPPCPACPAIPPCLPEDCPSLPPCTPATQQQPTAPPADADDDNNIPSVTLPGPGFPRYNAAVPAPPPASGTITTQVCCDCTCPTPPTCLPRLCPTPPPCNSTSAPTPAGMTAHGIEALVFSIIGVVLSIIFVWSYVTGRGGGRRRRRPHRRRRHRHRSGRTSVTIVVDSAAPSSASSTPTSATSAGPSFDIEAGHIASSSDDSD